MFIARGGSGGVLFTWQRVQLLVVEATGSLSASFSSHHPTNSSSSLWMSGFLTVSHIKVSESKNLVFWVKIRLSCHGWWRPTPPCQPPPPFNSSSLFLSNLPLILPAGQMAKWLKTASSSLVPTLKIEEASYERAAIFSRTTWIFVDKHIHSFNSD